MRSLTANSIKFPAMRRSGDQTDRSNQRARVSDHRYGEAPLLSDFFRPDGAEDFFAQMWTPGLLDQLQEPVTRYHE